MTQAVLTNLLNYLQGTLSPSNMRWIGEHLIECADKEESLKPYTMEEIHNRIAQSELDIAEGRVYDFDEVIRELEEEFEIADQKQEIAEAV